MSEGHLSRNAGKLEPYTGVKSVRVLTAAIVAALLLAGCGSQASPGSVTTSTKTGSGSATGKALDHVNMVLPWLMTGYDSAFVVAQDNGYYRRAGLSVKIIPGKNSTLSTEGVASGRYTFGFADAGSAAAVISNGGPVKLIAGLIQDSPVGLVYNPGTHLASMKDVKGMTVIANNTGGPTVETLYAALAHAGLQRSDIHLDLITPSAVAATFKSHPHDVLSAFVNASYAVALKLDPKALFVPYSKFGVNTLSLGLIASTSELKKDPGVVRDFVRASLQGWSYAAAHPTKAITMALKAFPRGNRFVWTKSLEMSAPLAHTPATKGKPLGWMASSDWKETLSVLHKFGGLKVVKPLKDYYTNAYLPKS